MKRFLPAYESRMNKYRRHLTAAQEYLAAAKRSQDSPAQLQIHLAEIRRLTELMALCRLICADINQFEEELNDK
ncbi:MAG: hypothetical protein RPR40_09480 [Bermanella sp.]